MIDAASTWDSSCVTHFSTVPPAIVCCVSDRPPSLGDQRIDDLFYSRGVRRLELTNKSIHVKGSFFGAYEVAGTPVTYRLGALGWNPSSVLPSVLGVGSIDTLDTIERKHIGIQQYDEVKDFLLKDSGIDLNAMQEIFNLAKAEFGGDAEYQYELIQEEGEDAYLILNVLINGLTMNEIIEKETRVFSSIAKNDSLIRANKYHIVTAI